jgi:hypothetical protein
MNSIKVLEELPGSVGAFVEDLPLLTTAHVKPYVIAILLHRGAVSRHEIIASISCHCRQDDIKVGAWDPLDGDYCDGTRLEKIVDEVLGEFVYEGILRYNDEQELWVLTVKHLPTVISWIAALGGKMPQHLLIEMSREQVAKLPEESLPSVLIPEPF